MERMAFTVDPIANGFIVTVGQHWTVGGQPGGRAQFFCADHAAIINLISQNLKASKEQANAQG